MNPQPVWQHYPRENRYALAMLQDIQKQHAYLPKEALVGVSNYLDMPLSEVYGLATFYKALTLEPRGRYAIRVCDGTACHIRGSGEILEALKDELDIGPGQTTEDGRFSIEVVNCLGACALAPVVMINEEYHGKMSRDKILGLVEACRRLDDE